MSRLTPKATGWNARNQVRRPLQAGHSALTRSQLVGDAGWQVMNEVTLHRGRNTHLTVVDAYFDGEHLTEAVVSTLRRLPTS